MLFRLAFISTVFCVSAVLAVRRREYHHATFLERVVQSINADVDVTTHSNWAGAVWEKGDGTFNSITATFAVPTAKGPDNSGGSVWVGLDGDTCKRSIFRAGVDFVVNKNVTSYEAWYQWYPEAPQFLSDVVISTGDRINVTVVANSSAEGSVTIENLATHRSTLKSAQSILALCGQNAEWVVELFGGSNDLASFANFTKVVFTDAKASGPRGSYAPYGATILDIVQDSHKLTSVSVSESALTIKRARRHDGL